MLKREEKLHYMLCSVKVYLSQLNMMMTATDTRALVCSKTCPCTFFPSQTSTPCKQGLFLCTVRKGSASKAKIPFQRFKNT